MPAIRLPPLRAADAGFIFADTPLPTVYCRHAAD